MTNTITYNGDGQRFMKQDSSGTIKFVWDDTNDLAEYNAANTQTALYTRTPEPYGLLITVTGAAEYFLYDAIGSVVAVTFLTPTCTRTTYLYKAFGENHPARRHDQELLPLAGPIWLLLRS